MNQRQVVIRFFVILISVYLIWYVLYYFVIEPGGRINAFLAYNIVSVNAGLLELFGYEVFVFDRVVGLWHTPGIEVIDGCTATEVFGLFIGFILAYPGSNQFRVIFIPLGLLIIYIVNVFRIFALVLVQNYIPYYFDASHDYTANTIFYLVIMVLWILWAVSSDSEQISKTTAAA